MHSIARGEMLNKWNEYTTYEIDTSADDVIALAGTLRIGTVPRASELSVCMCASIYVCMYTHYLSHSLDALPSHPSLLDFGAYVR